MKKVSLLTGIFMCLLFYGEQARAAYVTGNDLVTSCMGESPQEIFSCFNYVAGVIDYHTMMQSLGTVPVIDFCLPKSLPIDQAALAVLTYLKKSPQHASFIAAPAVIMALQKTYPCGPAVTYRKKKKRGK